MFDYNVNFKYYFQKLKKGSERGGRKVDRNEKGKTLLYSLFRSMCYIVSSFRIDITLASFNPENPVIS